MELKGCATYFTYQRDKTVANTKVITKIEIKANRLQKKMKWMATLHRVQAVSTQIFYCMV